MNDPVMPPLFQPPRWLRNGHLQTVWPTLFRRVELARPQRERLETPDNDFLNLDWYRAGHRRLAIISHGLEGHSRRPYVLGMVRMLQAQGWDVLAWNFRSCGGELNRSVGFYHSGATEDLDLVVGHGLGQGAYDRAALVGFSIGGNISLVYLGRKGDGLDSRVQGAVVFSVPCDLKGSAEQLARPENRIYMRRFVRDLRAKMIAKHQHFPDLINLHGIEQVCTFRQFDDRYTAPLHGFRDAEDYWKQCSSLFYLHRIRRPTLIVNAIDDPFLSAACYPQAEVRGNSHIQLETPAHGGHVGFVPAKLAQPGHYWSELRAANFLENLAAIGT
ncbi:alpha/beta hydrolase [Hydrocarboniclastica marina]|uniref:Alpha/beta hydrolase n=2 Tax=Hydrocarboniclastica marina TaxID=2259620 RepID=A0A4P7XFQ0_9ALTE|nr:alpha/beta hydrolase [Hydrocarboniclastica marina]